MAAHYPSSASSTPPPHLLGSSFASSSSTSHLGQTRSRTLLFLSYRESSGPSSSRRIPSGSDIFSAPYTDADDPLGSSSLHADSESHNLLPRRSREGHISLSVDELPPKWMDVSDQVDSILLAIRPRMDALSKLHEKHLRPGFADRSSEEKNIESLALEITKDFRRCSRLVAGLAAYTQHLMREAKRTGGEGEVTQSDLLLLEESTTHADQDILQRSKEIDEIAKSIQELATLFTDLQTLVIDQGTLLDRIDYNVELMSREIKGAVQELETATRYQRRSGRRQCILFLVLLCLLLVTIIVVKPFWRVFAGSGSNGDQRAANPPPPPSTASR
uniref:t-SNARE coiled-coil homology domain-containing protein n=1 Tax=Kalmanozyma brasiliensis (strain GHG001) TaxID=1365824 RepID=V5EUE8_KALBG